MSSRNGAQSAQIFAAHDSIVSRSGLHILSQHSENLYWCSAISLAAALSDHDSRTPFGICSLPITSVKSLSRLSFVRDSLPSGLNTPPLLKRRYQSWRSGAGCFAGLMFADATRVGERGRICRVSEDTAPAMSAASLRLPRSQSANFEAASATVVSGRPCSSMG